ncbi:MAG: ATP-binding protein [Hylemonella sp.]|nr:ATP-binding protein [Hylemonella sp.]
MFTAILTGHILALAVMFQLWPELFETGSGTGAPPPAGAGAVVDSLLPSPAFLETLVMFASFSHPGAWLDLGARLLVLVPVAGFCAHWLLFSLKQRSRKACELAPPRPRLLGAGVNESARRKISEVSPPATSVARMPGEADFFLAAVSHDLRAPLTRLALRVESLSSEEQQRGFWRDIREMNAMISSTLNHLRGVADPEPFVSLDLVSLLNSVADDQLASGHPVRIFDADPPLPCATLRTQASALRRCINNLVDNAVRYGGSAEIRYKDSTDHVCIEIRDHGPGIPDDERDKVLMPFYRMEGSRDRHGGGVGLGLSIANSIVQRLQGQLHLSNAAQGGLVVTVTLPR